MKANAIIESAYRKIGAKPRGFSLTPEQMQEGLEELNIMLASWADSELLIPARTIETKALTAGQITFTWGTAGDITTATPESILSAHLTDGTTDYPLRQYTYEEWERKADKVSQGLPRWFTYEYGSPLGYLRFEYAVQSGLSIVAASLKALTQFTTLTTEDDLPEAYLDAIRNNLAVRVAIERVGREAPLSVQRLAITSLKILKNKNASQRVQYAQVDSALLPHDGVEFNINTIE